MLVGLAAVGVTASRPALTATTKLALAMLASGPMAISPSAPNFHSTLPTLLLHYFLLYIGGHLILCIFHLCLYTINVYKNAKVSIAHLAYKCVIDQDVSTFQLRQLISLNWILGLSILISFSKFIMLWNSSRRIPSVNDDNLLWVSVFCKSFPPRPTI